MDHLFATEAAWIDDAPNDRIKAIRQLITDYISVLLTTGVRPSEALQLTWGDVDFFRDQEGIRNMRVWVPDDTKTGKRDAVAFARGEVTVTAMALVRKPELNLDFGGFPGRSVAFR